MKKIISIVLVVAMAICGCFALTACSPKSYQVGVQAGTTGEYYVKGDEDWGFDGYANLTCVGYQTGALAVHDMLNGNLDYVVLDEAPAKELVKNIEGIKVIDVLLTVEQYAFGVNKNDPTLLTQVNAFLAQIKTDGTFAAILDKYFNNTDSVVGITSKTYDPAKNQLVVATNAGFAPFEYKIGEKFAGIDMEIAAALAEFLDMELVIQNMEFDAVITSVGVNGIDIAMAGLTINETRQLSVNFSDSYYDASQVIICKANDKTFDGLTTVAEVEAKLASLKK